MSARPLTTQLRAALWTGLATGLGEALLLGAQKLLFGKRLHLGPQMLWMAPFANALLFLPLGLLLAGLARLAPAEERERWMRAGLAFFALASWLLLFERLQMHAALLLAIGAAWRLAPRGSRLPRALRRSARGAALLLLLVAGGYLGGVRFAEQRAERRLPPAPGGRPNVLLLVLDTVRAQNMSLYGYDRPTTPALEGLAARGTVFENAISPAPWTTPSHAGIFTGRRAHEIAAGWDRPLDEATPTLAERLRANGYATAGFVANTINCGYESGLARGFLHYEDYEATPGELAISASLSRAVLHADPLRRWLGWHQFVTRKSAADVNAAFLTWLARRPTAPFFAFLNYFDAHEPYLPPASFAGRFGPPARDAGRVTHRLRMAWRSDRERISPEENRSELAAYDAAIASLDDQIGALLATLDRQGLLARTLVIVTSDHGEAFGEHGRYAHGEDLYLTSIRVPLLLLWTEAVPGGARIATPVSLCDLPATILDLLALPGDGLPGESLARRWRDPASPATPVRSQVDIAPIMPHKFAPGAAAVMHSVIEGRYHAIKNVDGSEELYDILADPGERNDLHASRSGPARHPISHHLHE